MQMPGLLIEYFITGSVAIIWLSPLLNLLGYTLPQDNSYLTLLIPSIYVLGMFIDFLSGIVTRSLRRSIRERVFKKLNFIRKNWDESHFAEIQSFLYAPELVKAMEVRRSRARVARSTTVNSFIATLIFTAFFIRSNDLLIATIYFVCGCLLTFAFYSMWTRSQSLSEGFEIESVKALEEKSKKEKLSEKKSQ